MKNDTVSILIVDDEPEARDLLGMLLERIENVEIAGKAEGVDDALLQVTGREPDLILLDIQMPGRSGFELVNQLNQLGKNIGYVFVTAYDEYAIQAVRAAAFDYLLKPVDPDELATAIARFRANRKQKVLRDHIDLLLSNLGMGRRLKLNTRTGFMVIDPRDVVCCIADGNYTEIVLANERREIISSNLGSLEKDLDGDGFFRVSRSALISLRYLTYVCNKTGTCRVQGASVLELKVARNRLRELDSMFLR